MEFLNRKRAWILSITSMSQALLYLESTVMPVALPTIAKDLVLTDLFSMWIINIYFLMLVMFFMVGGRLSDVYGKKPCFMIGLFLFGVGSLLGSVSYDRSTLFLARAIQGLGGALNIPTIGALIVANFPVEVRARAVGINSSLSSFFLLTGPVIGGAITHYFGWRYIFWINIPIVIFIFITMYFVLPKEEKKPASLGISSSIPLVVSLFCLVLALMQGPFWGWSSFKDYILFPIAALSLFLYHQISKRSENPIFKEALLKIRYFRASVTNIFIHQWAAIVTIFLPLFLQEGRGFNTIESGAMIMVASAPYLFMPTIGGFLTDRISPRLPISIGFFVATLGLVMIFIFAMGSLWILMIGFFLYGMGSPMIFSPSYSTAMTSAPKDSLGAASSLITTIRQIAATVGLAVMTAVYHSVHIYCNSFFSAISAVVLMSIVLTITGFILTQILMRKPKENTL